MARFPLTEQDGRAGAEYHELIQSNEGKIGPPWKQDAQYGDLYPEQMASETPGIGTVNNPVHHVACGLTGESGTEGVLGGRNASDGGGMYVLGLRGLDPENPPTPPVTGNAPVELNGNVIVLAGGAVYLELEQAITKDHEVILGPSTTDAQGRHFAPLLLGPEKVYVHSEEATDTRDIDVLDLGEVSIVSLTLANAYTAGRATFSYQVMLENLGNRDTVFDIIIKLDAVEALRTSHVLRANSQVFTYADVIANPVAAGSVIEMFVLAVGTHQNSQGWVRGATTPSTIGLDQS